MYIIYYVKEVFSTNIISLPLLQIYIAYYIPMYSIVYNVIKRESIQHIFFYIYFIHILHGVSSSHIHKKKLDSASVNKIPMIRGTNSKEIFTAFAQ